LDAGKNTLLQIQDSIECNGCENNHYMVSEVRFEKLVYGGDALARVEGQVLLAPYALAGETAKVEITGQGKGLLRGKVLETVAPSPARTEPGCRYFARCGGCHYQHAVYGHQLEQKREILRETLRRTGKIEAPEQIGTAAAEPWRYRNRVQLHFHESVMGFHEAGTHQVINIEECPISSPRINESIRSLRAMMADRRWPRFVKSIELFTNEREVQVNVLDSGGRRLQRAFFDWCEESMPGATARALDYEAAGFLFRVSHQAFFQVNRFLIEPLVETALAGAAGETATDLYAGVGLFSLPLARRFASVTAVESGAAAVADLAHNAQRAGVAVQALRAAAELHLEGLARRPDFVLADPPRAGLGAGVVRQLLRLAPPCLTVVSCDPSTLARDLAALVGGGYRLAALTLVDLFPQTCHIESVAVLRK
jgi:23S rRNA (uracil1939-C5)-methyltransferase